MQPRTLIEALELAYADKLRAIYDVIGGNNPPRPGRKDQLVPAINRILFGRVIVPAEWDCLTNRLQASRLRPALALSGQCPNLFRRVVGVRDLDASRHGFLL